MSPRRFPPSLFCSWLDDCKEFTLLQDDEEEEIVFGSRSDGFIRPSDRSDSSEQFKRSEPIGFGETAETPPDLALWKDKLAQKAQKMTKKPAKVALKTQNSVELEKIRSQAIEAYKQIKEKRRKESGISSY